MSLGNREGGADDDAEPEDLPNLVRRSAAPRGGAPPPLHPAMDRTAGFFRVRKPRLPWTGLLHGAAQMEPETKRDADREGEAHAFC